jgi:hypothetical protein
MPIDTSSQPSTLTVAPKGSMVAVARVYHLIVALVGTSALTISLILSATSPVSGGAFNGIVFTLSYFTVWSNIVALIVNWMLAANPTRDGLLFRWIRMTALVMIVITGLIYALILAASANPCGWGIYTNLGFHYIVPWATLLGFLLFGPRPRFTWDLVPKMMIIPVAWLGYTLLHGLMKVNAPGSTCSNIPLEKGVNFYPYPFINVNYDNTGGPSALVPGLEAGGYAGVAINLVVIIILGLVMASIFVGLDKLLSRGAKPTPLGKGTSDSAGADPTPGN